MLAPIALSIPYYSKCLCRWTSMIRSFSSSSTTPSNHQDPLLLLLQCPHLQPHILQIHGRIFRLGAHQDNLLATRLIGLYPFPLALRVFYHLQSPSIFPFNALIRILAENGLVLDAVSIFKNSRRWSLSPNDFTFSFLLKAFVRSTGFWNFYQFHTHIVKLGFDRDPIICNGLLTIYAKGFRDLLSAKKVFDEIPDRRMVCSWACLIAGYAQQGQAKEAMHLFLQMVEEKLIPDDHTMVNVLSACSILEPLELEKWVKVLAEFQCLNAVSPMLHDSIRTVLIFVYGKIGDVQKSREIFDKMSETVRGQKSLHAWNAMIGGYVQNGYPMEALSLFRLMVVDTNSKPNHVTMVSVLSACSQVGDLDLGRWVHNYMKTEGQRGILESNSILATALIDMYSKCGSLESAQEIFDKMRRKDVISFNAMIMGLAINGQGEEALRLFSQLGEHGIHPNDGTVIGVLSACAHSGLVNEGHSFFTDMCKHFSAMPKLEHYSCFVDLLARAGNVKEALEVVQTMPFEPNAMVWGALLGACLVHSKADLAPYVAQQLVDVDPKNSAGYVMLSNLYAVRGQWSSVAELRNLKRERRITKQPGCSWISIDGCVHEFLAGSASHPQMQRIHLALDGLFKEMRLMGYFRGNS